MITMFTRTYRCCFHGLISLVLVCVSFVSSVAFATMPTWKIISNESSITFTGVQNDAPTTGSFNAFTGDIAFDPKDLGASKVRMVVDMQSMFTSYAEIASTLKTEDWFDIKAFPKAIFESHDFTETSPNHYEANGTLTIRDKTLPIKLSFEAETLGKTKTRVKVKGRFIVKRTAFGVGQGEWADTSAVKDNVDVYFVIIVEQVAK